jgi:hypothetical protein
MSVDKLSELQEDCDLLVAEIGTLREELDKALAQRDSLRALLREALRPHRQRTGRAMTTLVCVLALVSMLIGWAIGRM